MFKNLMLAAALAVSAFSLPQAAEAKSKIHIDLGIGGGCYGNPYYCDNGPGWDDGYYDNGYDDYEPGYGIYHPREVQYYRPRVHDSLRCKEARWLLEERGWRNVRARDCNGVSYSFTASRRGVVSIVSVSAYSGRITSIRRLSH